MSGPETTPSPTGHDRATRSADRSETEPEIRAGGDMTMSELPAVVRGDAAPKPESIPEPTHQTFLSEEAQIDVPPLSTMSMRPPPNPSSGGAEAVPTTLGLTQSGDSALHANTVASPATTQLGRLHKRRASTSPEKFNTGKFEPLALRIETPPDNIFGPPPKRARLENKVEIRYDSLGTPRIASITPTIALPFGLFIPNVHFPHTNPTRKAFSLLEAFCKDNALLLLLASYLPLPSLLRLYAISRAFHLHFNQANTAFILSSMRTWAPQADHIYPWRCYKSLCLHDPSLRQKSFLVGTDLKAPYSDLHDVPSLRWLQMVVWRQGVCTDILFQLATQGLRCPAGTLDALRRTWFIMDLPLNAHRIALARSDAYLPARVLKLATLFFLKLDMRFTDPAGAVYPLPGPHTNSHAYPRHWARRTFIGCDLRELLTAERHLTPLWRVLRALRPDGTDFTTKITRLDILRLWIRHAYRHPPNTPAHVKHQSIMGIPSAEIGTAGLERTGVLLLDLDGKRIPITHPSLLPPAGPHYASQEVLYPHQKRILIPANKAREPLLRPEELVLREGVRRKLGLHRLWGRMMLWGFCDDLGRNLAVRTEEELVGWRRGKVPLSWYLTDEEVLGVRERERERERVEKEGGMGSEGAGEVVVDAGEEGGSE